MTIKFKYDFQLSQSSELVSDGMMTDQNSAVLEVSVEEKGVTPMPPTVLNDAPTVNVIISDISLNHHI